MKNPFGCGGGHRNLHMWLSCIKWNIYTCTTWTHTQAHVNLLRPEWGPWSVSVPVSWLWRCTSAMWDDNTGEEYTEPLFVISYDCESTVISKKNIFVKEKKKKKKKKAGALVMGWSDLCLLTPPPSSVFRRVHGFLGHVLTRQSEHVINVFCQFLAIGKWFICVFFPLCHF